MPQKLPGYMSSNEKYNFNVNRFGGNNNYYRNYTNNSGTMNKVNSIKQPSSSYGNNSYSNVSNSFLVPRRENDNLRQPIYPYDRVSSERFNASTISKYPSIQNKTNPYTQNGNNNFLESYKIKPSTNNSFNEQKDISSFRKNQSTLVTTKQANKKPIAITPSDSPQFITSTLNGLLNLRNTCYANTCIQNLVHCSVFITVLFDKSESNGKKITKSFKNCCTSLASSTRYFNPTEFLDTFTRSHSSFNSYAQHDTQEFCRSLLDDISKETNRVKNIPQYKEFNTSNKSKKVLDIEFDKFFREREDSIIVDIFYSQLATTYTCQKCNFTSFSFEKFLDLPLQFPQKAPIGRPIDLNDMLNDHFKDEQIDWESKCEGCQCKTSHTKHTRISSLPKVLIISFQRYNIITNRKINASVKYGESIDLKDYIDNDLIETYDETRYRLFGVSNHAGTMDFGHYYANVKVNDKWYQFNDEMVTECKMGFEATSAYCLFYEKYKD